MTLLAVEIDSIVHQNLPALNGRSNEAWAQRELEDVEPRTQIRRRSETSVQIHFGRCRW